MTLKPVQKVLIANRGEIAIRIARALRERGRQSIAVYSDADHASRHRTACDFAVRLPGKTSAETYLNMDALIDAARRAGADAIHPGYGFLSESSAFARAVEKAGLTFIGPTPEAMDLMGNKIKARELMKKHGVPVVPGSEMPLRDAEDLQARAREIGYPMILKAAAGGGGRGMRVVRSDADLSESFAACQREAIAYFGNDEVFCERYIEHPRHIEFQVLFDAHGHGVHLFERDCSIQRRHQKLIEEAPSQYFSTELREKVGALAVTAGLAAGYRGAGTVEFICESPDRIYFMEMNTRIQVEHPVTELITGVDLIGWQIRIADGEALSLRQEDIQLRGWAFEARINAEDPTRDFAPSPGRILEIDWPAGPFVRVDTHVYPGYEIPSEYDSMIAKLIVWGADRTEALARLKRALAEMRLTGVPTTASFHEAVIAHPKFVEGDFTTSFLVDEYDELQKTMAGQSATSSSMFAAGVLLASRGDQRLPDPTRSTWMRTARQEGLR